MDYVIIHHGIKGQKWGVRRFKNEDGSLTQKGKDRYTKKRSKKEKAKDVAISVGRLAIGTLLLFAPEIIDSYNRGRAYVKAQNLMVDAYAEAKGGLNAINAGFTLGAKQVSNGKRIVESLLKGGSQ